MKDVEIKNICKESFSEIRDKANNEKIMNFKEFDKKIRMRDKIEILAALISIVFFGSFAIFMENDLSRIGAAFIVIGAVVIIVVLQTMSKIKKTEINNISNKQYILNYLNQIRKQKSLLKNVAFWYIIPLYGGLVLFQWGLSRSITHFIFFLIVYTFGSIAIFIYNQKAIKDDLEPLEGQLENFLNELNKPL